MSKPKTREEDWQEIDVSANIKSFILERWSDGSWANVLPELEYRKSKRTNSIAFLFTMIALFIIWMVM